MGYGGDDLIQGGQGVDYAFGGFGNDRIFGMTKNDPGGSTFGDILFGEQGDDTLTGSGGGDGSLSRRR